VLRGLGKVEQRLHHSAIWHAALACEKKSSKFWVCLIFFSGVKTPKRVTQQCSVTLQSTRINLIIFFFFFFFFLFTQMDRPASCTYYAMQRRSSSLPCNFLSTGVFFDQMWCWRSPCKEQSCSLAGCLAWVDRFYNKYLPGIVHWRRPTDQWSTINKSHCLTKINQVEK
jgi:hypothetical protein